MSWFADLAGKAEDFLNKVDQGAATALTKSQARTSSFSSPYGGESTAPPDFSAAGYQSSAAVTHHASNDAASFISTAAGNIKRSNATVLAGTANMASVQSGSGSTAANTAKTSSGFVRPKKSEQHVDDDLLFDFLNSSDPPGSNRRDSRRELVREVTSSVTEGLNPTPPPSTTPLTVPSAPSTPPSTRGVSRASSLSSLSAHSVKTSEESSAKDQSQGVLMEDGSIVPVYLQVITVVFVSEGYLGFLSPPQTHQRVQTRAWLLLRRPAGRSLPPPRSPRTRCCRLCVWRTSCCAAR